MKPTKKTTNTSLALAGAGTAPASATAATTEEVFPRLRTYAYGQDRRCLTVIEKQVKASFSNSTAREDLETRLGEILETDATFDAKQFVCRQLRLIGSARVVPKLAKLLTDPRLSCMARYALESIPDPTADQALRDALKTTRGELLIGVINSIGQRADKEAVPGLKLWLAFKDEQISAAAAAALGRIGGPKAMDALRIFAGSTEPRSLDAVLRAADSLLAEGLSVKAGRIYRTVYHNLKASLTTRFAGLRGWLTAQPDQAERVIRALEKDPDEQTRLLAASLLQKPFTPGLTRK
jgi:HEAT repeat protein